MALAKKPANQAPATGTDTPPARDEAAPAKASAAMEKAAAAEAAKNKAYTDQLAEQSKDRNDAPTDKVEDGEMVTCRAAKIQIRDHVSGTLFYTDRDVTGPMTHWLRANLAAGVLERV